MELETTNKDRNLGETRMVCCQKGKKEKILKDQVIDLWGLVAMRTEGGH